MLRPAWNLDWKGKETGDKDPQLGQIQEKRQRNEYQEEEGAPCACLDEFRESQGCCPHSRQGQLLCGANLGQTVWTHMQVEHWSPVSSNKMLEM